jgi:hypothetical protein
MPANAKEVSVTPRPAPAISVQAPYEGAIIAIIDLFKTIIEGQTEQQKAELWRMHIEDLKGWREFWQKVGGIFNREDKE